MPFLVFPLLSFIFLSPSRRINGTDGTTGTIAVNGTATSDYLYWSASNSTWMVGSQNVNLGGDAVASGQNAVAIGANARAIGLYGSALGYLGT
jgi:hypothetical protein